LFPVTLPCVTVRFDSLHKFLLNCTVFCPGDVSNMLTNVVPVFDRSCVNVENSVLSLSNL
jgi:hypothetical protein